MGFFQDVAYELKWCIPRSLEKWGFKEPQTPLSVLEPEEDYYSGTFLGTNPKYPWLPFENTSQLPPGFVCELVGDKYPYTLVIRQDDDYPFIKKAEEVEPMKISNLISQLVTEWWEHGDVKVAVDDGYDPHSPELDYSDGKLFLW